jgi:hypothetical protein
LPAWHPKRKRRTHGPPFCFFASLGAGFGAAPAAYFTCVSSAAQAFATPRSGSEPGNVVNPAFSISS